MITSKPKGSTIMSLGIFLFIAYSLGIWSAISIPETGEVSMFRYVLTVLIFIIAVIVTSRVLWSYKTLTLSENSWQVHYLLRTDVKFNTKDIEWWQITKVKTRGGLYQELQVRTIHDARVKLSPQEHTGFEQVLEYLSRKCPGKRREDL